MASPAIQIDAKYAASVYFRFVVEGRGTRHNGYLSRTWHVLHLIDSEAMAPQWRDVVEVETFYGPCVYPCARIEGANRAKVRAFALWVVRTVTRYRSVILEGC